MPHMLDFVSNTAESMTPYYELHTPYQERTLKYFLGVTNIIHGRLQQCIFTNNGGHWLWDINTSTSHTSGNEFKRMLSGLRNACGTIQGVMDIILPINKVQFSRYFQR